MMQHRDVAKKHQSRQSRAATDLFAAYPASDVPGTGDPTAEGRQLKHDPGSETDGCPRQGSKRVNESLLTTLRKLRLSSLAQSLEVRLQEAAGHNLSHAEFLELIFQDELAVRSERSINRRIKAAGFRELKTLDHFDFAFNPSIKKKQIFDLATGAFIRQARDLLILGPPDVVT